MQQVSPLSEPGFDESWNTRSGAELRSAVERFYSDTFHDDTQIRRYFATHYVQHVDGKTLRFHEFLTHVGFLRGATKSLRFEVIDAVYTNGLMADRHRVHFVKNTGEAIAADDPLLDDNLFMVMKWAAAGNRGELAVYRGGIHGFAFLPIALAREAAARSERFIADCISEAGKP